VQHYREKGNWVSLLKLEGNRVVSLFFLEAIALCLIASFYFVNIESTVTLLVFNFLFLSLTLGLNGKLNRKLGLLTLGNVIGLFWNLVLNLFAVSAGAYFGDAFEVLFQISRPLLSFMWMISFWALSLSALPNSRGSRVGAKT
jgi:hypothetical protein